MANLAISLVMARICLICQSRRWAALNLTEEAEYWIEANTREKLYQLGSQPPLTLAIHGARGGTGASHTNASSQSGRPGCAAASVEWHPQRHLHCSHSGLSESFGALGGRVARPCFLA